MKTNEVIEVRLKTGVGRVWQIRENCWGWASPDGSEGTEPTCEKAIEECMEADYGAPHCQKCGNQAGERKNEPIMTTTLPESKLTNQQHKSWGPRPIDGYGKDALIQAHVRYDDACGNGHNTFGITATVRVQGKLDVETCRCMHEEIAKAFPELSPLIKWHSCSSDGPLHYLANTIYHAGDRDHNGLRAGEFRQHRSRGAQNGGVAGVPNWVLEVPERSERDIYAAEKPAPVTLDWKAYGLKGEGKARDFGAARATAIWPDATDEQLSLPAEELGALLEARLPALMEEFKKAMESLGFTY